MGERGFKSRALPFQDLDCTLFACGAKWLKPELEPIMEIKKNISGESWEFILSGRLDGPGANDLEVEILAALRQGAKSIFVNLAEATFLCSAGLRVVLQFHRQMKSKGMLLQVTRPSPEVAATLEMTGFSDLVEK